MSSTSITKLEVAKELTLKAMEKMRMNVDVIPGQQNERLAEEVGKMFNIIYNSVSEASKGSEPRQL